MNAITTLQPSDTMLPSNPADLVFSDHAFGRLERLAEIMAGGKATIPAHLRGNAGDCFAILLQSARWRMDPYAVAQKTHLVNGALGYEAQLVIAVLNANAPLDGRLQFAWFGPWDRVANGKTDKSAAGVRVFATLRGEAEPTLLEITMAQAGVRNSPLWADDPRQQLAYLAAKRWARLYCPDVILGVYTPDELMERDMGPAQRIDQPAPTSQGASIKARLRGARSPTPTVEMTTPTVLERIAAAESLEALAALKDDAAALPDEQRAAARKAFRARSAELKKAVEVPAEPTVDQETGELLEPETTESGTVDLRQDEEFRDWLDAVDRCTTESELTRLSHSMPPATRATLAGELARRLGEIRNATGESHEQNV